MAATTTWISTTLLPPSAVVLGRLVSNISNPENNFQDTSWSAERPNGPKIEAPEFRQVSFDGQVTASRGWDLTAVVSAVLESTFSIHREEVVSVTADACKTQRLPNAAAYFRTSCQSEAVRQWLEGCWRWRRPAYMAVGIKTLVDARVTLRLAKKRDVGPKLKVPGAVALVDAEVGVSHRRGDSTESSYEVPGDSVLAVEYQQVRFSWFRKPSVEDVVLKEGPAWKTYLGSRGEDSDAEDAGQDSGDSDDNDDFVTLEAVFGGEVGDDDVREFDDYEDFTMDDGVMLHIS